MKQPDQQPIINADSVRKLSLDWQGLLILVDFIMLGLIVLNLSLIVFDTLFASGLFQDLLGAVFPTFTAFYRDTVHADFVSYDMIFVGIFITELLVRWGIAIYQQTYYRWFFYPFVHWYDVLGCIPVGSFRWLRLLRVISILYRLQKYNIIDITKTYPYRIFDKYLAIVVEEVSDRVVVNVLSGVQQEIVEGNAVVDKIVDQVIMPRKQLIVAFLTERINDITAEVYPPRKQQIEQYIDRIIADSISQDAKVSAIEKMPIVGEGIVSVIETTVSKVVFGVIDHLVEDIGSSDTDILVEELTDLVIDKMLEPAPDMSNVGKEVAVDVIEVIKEEVKVQRWKESGSSQR